MGKSFIREKGSIALYKQVADWMRSHIETGEWPEGHKLLAEEDLAKELEISRGTLRKAIGLLIEEKLLVQVQGIGTFVEKNKISYPFAQELISFAESMESKGYHFETTVLGKSIEKPDSHVQNKLNITEIDDVLYLKRKRLINDKPAIILENWIALHRCEGIEEVDFKEMSLFKAIEKYSGANISHGVRSFSAGLLNKEQATLLQLNENDPVLYLEQITYGQQDIPLECSQVLLRTDKYEITSVLRR